MTAHARHHAYCAAGRLRPQDTAADRVRTYGANEGASATPWVWRVHVPRRCQPMGCRWTCFLTQASPMKSFLHAWPLCGNTRIAASRAIILLPKSSARACDPIVSLCTLQARYRRQHTRHRCCGLRGQRSITGRKNKKKYY